MCTQISPGCGHTFRQHDERSVTLERRDKDCILRREVSLAKPADRLEGTLSAEQTRAAWLPEHLDTEHEQGICHPPPKRKPPLEPGDTAAANRAIANAAQTRL